MYPFAQVGETTLDWLAPAEFKYTITFHQKTTDGYGLVDTESLKNNWIPVLPWRWSMLETHKKAKKKGMKNKIQYGQALGSPTFFLLLTEQAFQ